MINRSDGLLVLVYFWIDTSKADYFASIDRVIKGIKRAFEQEGITISFPSHRVYQLQSQVN